MARVVFAAVAVAAGTLGTSAWSASGGAVVPATTPSDVILSAGLPGFVAAPPGIFNGPISGATLSSRTKAPVLLSEIAQGAVSAYLRTWGHTSSDGTSLLTDFVVEFPDAAQTTDFLEELEFTMIGQFNAATSVPAAPSGAIGYSTSNQLVPRSTDYAIAFGRGNFASFVIAATPRGSVTAGQIQYMAVAQWDALGAAAVAAPSTAAAPLPQTLPGTTLAGSSTGGLLAVAVLGLVLLVLLVLFLLLVQGVVSLVGRQRSRWRLQTTPSPLP